MNTITAFVGSTSTAKFIFEDDPDSPLSEKIFYKGGRSKHSIGSDRIIQRYLEAERGRPWIHIFPFVFDEDLVRHSRGRTILFTADEDEEEIFCHIRASQLLAVEPCGLFGFASIHTGNMANRLRASIGDHKDTTITETAERVFSGFSPNLSSLIHKWMRGRPDHDGRRFPVFMPETHRSTAAGCRLSYWDNMTVALLLQMFRHDVRATDFVGSVRFRVVKFPKFDDLFTRCPRDEKGAIQ